MKSRFKNLREAIGEVVVNIDVLSEKIDEVKSDLYAGIAFTREIDDEVISNIRTRLKEEIEVLKTLKAEELFHIRRRLIDCWRSVKNGELNAND